MYPDSNEYMSKFKSWALDAFLNTSWVNDPNLWWFGTCIDNALKSPEKAHDGPFIFGLCGNAGTGKDSALEYLRYNPYSGPIAKLAFADPIREIGKIFGFTPHQMSDRKLKETVDEFWGFSPRTFMQKVGTEMFRNCLREDIWIKLLEKRINDLRKVNQPENENVDTDCRGFFIDRPVDPIPSIIFITDVRFPNEAEAIKKMGGYIIKIKREGFSKSGENLHPSEKFIDQMEADCVIENKSKDADEWSWYFAKFITIFIKHDAFYEIH